MQRPDTTTSRVAFLRAVVSKKSASVVDALSIPPASAFVVVVAAFGIATFRTQLKAVRRNDVALMTKAAVAAHGKFLGEDVRAGTIVLAHPLESEPTMKPSFEQALVEVWRQALIENAKFVVLEKERHPVRLTPKRSLRQVDFVLDGDEIRGLEQNPDTKSRWAQMARSGRKVMQFLTEGRYVANVVDGKVTLYGRRAGTGR